MEDVRRVREAVRPVELAPVEQLAEELEQLPARVLPREVRVALREAGLGERRHRRRPREGLGEEDHLRVLAPHLADQPLPERQRLRVRVVDAEDGDRRSRPSGARRRAAPARARASPRTRSRRCRCPGSASAGSRRTSASRRGGGGTTRDAPSATGGRASTGSRSRARSRSRASSRRRRARGAPARCRAPGRSRRGRPPPSRSPTGCRRRRASPSRRCSGPCGSCARSGGSAAGRGRRSRARRSAAAARGRRRSRPTSAGRARTTSRSGRARGRRPRSTSPTTPSRSASPAGAASACLDRQLLVAEQHRALRQLAREVGLARRDLAPQLLLERGDAVDPRLDPEAPEPGPVDLERAGPEVVAERLERRLAPARRVRALVANRRAERLVPVAEDPRGHLDLVAGGALDRIAAAVDLRRHLLDLDSRGRRLRDRHAPSLTDEEGSKRGALPFGRHPPPSDLASVREARPRRVPVRRLARRRRPVVVAGAAARAARRVRLAVPLAVGVRGLARSSWPGRTRGSRPARSRTSSRAIRTGPAAGRASPATRRRSPTRCASSGSGERCATYAAERGVRLIGDLPIYVSDGGADLDVLAGAVRARRGRRRAARRAQRDRPALGEPALRLARRIARPATAGGASGSGARSSSSTSAASTTSAASSPTGRSRRGTRRRSADHWRPGPGAELFRAVERELGDLPVIAEDLGHITPPVYTLRDELGLPGMVVLLWAFRRRQRNPHSAREPPAQLRRVHEHARHGHRRRLVRRAHAARAERHRPRSRSEPSWGLIELAYSSRAELAIVPAQDVLGLGSEARMNRPGETEGNWRWQLERAH